jgi:purine-binding chemotaxis protein CheW
MTIEMTEGTELAAAGRSMMTMGSETRRAPVSWLLCRTGSHHFALPVQRVVEIMRMLPIETVAGCPPIVRGVSVIRGTATPVIDVALLFDGQHGQCERLVTVRTGKRTIALATQAVVGICETADGELDDLPPLLGNAEAIAGLKALDQQLVFLLHTARIIADDILVRLDSAGVQA